VVRTPTKFIYERQYSMYSYQWEFLRRNKKYQNDYDTFLKETKGQNVDRRSQSPESKSIEKEYGFYPLDYNLSHEDIFAIIRGRSDKAKTFTKWQNEEIRAFYQKCRIVGFVAEDIECSNDSLDQFLHHTENMTFKKIPWPGTKEARKELSQVKSLKVIINLMYPEEMIHCHLGDLIKHYQSFIKKRRVDYLKFDEYLKIYDLKTQGKTFAAIVYEMFPGTADRNYNSYLERVKRGYKKASELVSGQWQDIR